ncbi:glycosyltransferase family protein [Dethiobacter alkaliphilus]|uniref:Uncharacterized protein n=1 Tax=Dethiobacter alkaliphilus AHT 1 TaxID=555088 RepID=C0GEN3_DETAL|nr:glycosyltransferase family 1 protein [Dethiobacter alkaliphilus]EEG78065.1 hypothetical protein DealDRAFT_0942 [Dethiobacter alkaliphilus AHT 1]
MIIGLIRRGQNDNLSLALASSVAAEAGQAYLFTDDALLARDLQMSSFARFNLRVGERIQPVTVKEAGKDAVRIFFIQESSPLFFAAAVAATLGQLAAQEKTKPDFLQLFCAQDIVCALLCRAYRQIPFIYHVCRLTQCKMPLRDLHSLGLTLPAGSLQLGETFLAETAAAAAAVYVVDESMGQKPQHWADFFSAYAGKVVEGFPAVNTAYWSHIATNDAPRPQRKKQVLAAAKKTGYLLATGDPPYFGDALPEEIVFLPPAGDESRRQTLLQATDFYFFDGERGKPQEALAAMAAGSIVITSASPFTKSLVTDETTDAQYPTGYLYQDGEQGWQETVARAVRDFRQRTDWQQAMRQRSRSRICERFGLEQAAKLCVGTCRGVGPVKLPFIIKD